MQEAHADPQAQGRMADKRTKPYIKRVWDKFRADRILAEASKVMRESSPTSAEKKAQFLLARQLNNEMWYVPTELVVEAFLLEIAHTDRERDYFRKWNEYRFHKDLKFAMPIAVNFALGASPKQKRQFAKLVRSHPDVTVEALISLASHGGFVFHPKVLAIKAQAALSKKARENQTSADPAPSIPSRKDGPYGQLALFLYRDEAKARLELSRKNAAREVEDLRRKAA